MLRYSTYQSIYDKPTLNKSNLSGLYVMRLRKRLTKVMLMIMILTITCTGMVTVFAASSDGVGNVGVKSVVVSSGDTLWEIAASHKPRGEDTRVYIEHIKKYNGLKVSSIKAGDVLLLPSK